VPLSVAQRLLVVLPDFLLGFSLASRQSLWGGAALVQRFWTLLERQMMLSASVCESSGLACRDD